MSCKGKKNGNSKRQTQPSGGFTLKEDAGSTIQKNNEFIRQLKEENRNLRTQLVEAERRDKQKSALTRTSSEYDAFLKMSTSEREEALSHLEYKVLSNQRKINAEQADLKAAQQRWDGTKTNVGGAGPADVQALKEAKEKEVRALQNRVDKTQFKCRQKAELVNSYQKVRDHMQDESLTYLARLDGLETQLLNRKKELQQLLVKHRHIQLSTEAEEASLQQHQQLLLTTHQERKSKMAIGFKDHEYQGTEDESVEVQSEDPPRPTCPPGEEDSAPSSFTQTLRNLQEAKDLQEISESFITQKETQDSLEKMKKENEEVQQQLREQKQRLVEEVENMKRSAEATLLRRQQELQERSQQLQHQQQGRAAAKERRDQLMKTSVPVRAGVEHLSRKLQHIHLNQDVAPGDPAPGHADDKVVQLAKRLELQSQVLLRELEGQDLAAARKEMEESEYWDTIQREMPAYNTRVLVPGDQDTDHGSL